MVLAGDRRSSIDVVDVGPVHGARPDRGEERSVAERRSRRRPARLPLPDAAAADHAVGRPEDVARRRRRLPPQLRLGRQSAGVAHCRSTRRRRCCCRRDCRSARRRADATEGTHVAASGEVERRTEHSSRQPRHAAAGARREATPAGGHRQPRTTEGAGGRTVPDSIRRSRWPGCVAVILGGAACPRARQAMGDAASRRSATRRSKKPRHSREGRHRPEDRPAAAARPDVRGRAAAATSGSGDYFGGKPGRAGARLLRVPDALHAGAQRHDRRAEDAVVRRRQGLRRRRRQHRPARQAPTLAAGEEGDLPQQLRTAGRRRRAGTS